ncbi:MAG: glycosyltransferase [Kineosporiaceae bacterium]
MSPTVPPQGRVLLVSSNGAGMGHLTRLMAMARRRSPGVDVSFASMSSAVPVVGGEGFRWEYIPSRDDLGIGPRRWNLQLRDRLGDVLDRLRPDVLVFDGTFPYDAVLDARRQRRDLRLVWSRRGMWLAGKGRVQLSRARRFDLIIEPGDLAAEADPGLTRGRGDAVPVGPITLLDPAEQVSREEAAAALGVDPTRPTALVTFGGGAIDDRDSAVGLVLNRLLADPDLQVLLTRPMISAQVDAFGGRVRSVALYPLARYLRAVDLAVSAAGYNTFHEFLQSGVPTAFVAKPRQLDDQGARAAWAAREGAAVHLRRTDADGVAEALDVLLDAGARAALRRRCAEIAQPNGAAAAMAAVEGLLPSAATGGSR